MLGVGYPTCWNHSRFKRRQKIFILEMINDSTFLWFKNQALRSEIRSCLPIHQPDSNDPRYNMYLQKSSVGILFPKLPKEILALISYYLHLSLFNKIEETYCYYTLCLEIPFVFNIDDDFRTRYTDLNDNFKIRHKEFVSRLSHVKVPTSTIKNTVHHLCEIRHYAGWTNLGMTLNGIQRDVLFRLSRLDIVQAQLSRFSYMYSFKPYCGNFYQYTKLLKQPKKFERYIKSMLRYVDLGKIPYFHISE